MTLPDLPEDLYCADEASTHQLIAWRTAGEQATERLLSTVAGIIHTARHCRDSHLGYQAILKADCYTRVLDGGLYDRYEHLDRLTDITSEGVVVRMRIYGCKGDPDETLRRTIPLGWLWMSQPQLLTLFHGDIDQRIAAREAELAEEAKQQEAQEKAQLAALLAKHGGAAP